MICSIGLFLVFSEIVIAIIIDSPESSWIVALAPGPGLCVFALKSASPEIGALSLQITARVISQCHGIWFKLFWSFDYSSNYFSVWDCLICQSDTACYQESQMTMVAFLDCSIVSNYPPKTSA